MSVMREPPRCVGCGVPLKAAVHPGLSAREAHAATAIMTCGKPECRASAAMGVSQLTSVVTTHTHPALVKAASAAATAVPIPGLRMRSAIAGEPSNIFQEMPNGDYVELGKDETVDLAAARARSEKVQFWVVDDIKYRDDRFHFYGSGNRLRTTDDVAEVEKRLTLLLQEKRMSKKQKARVGRDIKQAITDHKRRIVASPSKSREFVYDGLVDREERYPYTIQLGDDTHTFTVEDDMMWRHRLNGEVVVESRLEAHCEAAVQAFMDSLTPEQTSQAAEQLGEQYTEYRRAADKKKRDAAKTALIFEKFDAIIAELMAWQSEGLKLQRLQATGWHKLMTEMDATRVCSPWARQMIGSDGTAPMANIFGTSAPLNHSNRTIEMGGDNAHVQPFVVEHNWASAFSDAQDYHGGDVQLPYDVNAFEFLFSGKRVIALMTEHVLGIFVEVNKAENLWAIPQFMYGRRDGWEWAPTQTDHRGTGHVDHFEPLKNAVLEQVRAIAIALDAEIATSETIRQPEKLNRKRVEQGKQPLADYHVVKIGRHRAAPMPVDHEPEHDDTRRRKRFHFVRGHWRHYSNHRTWIKWHARGDIDLGFIDKEYRL